MKRVYLYLKDGSYTTFADIPDTAPTPPLATTDPIPDALKKPIRKDGKWVEATGEGKKQPAYSDVLSPLPSEQKKIISQLALQQAQFQSNQQKLNSQLALRLATLTAKGA